MLSAGTSAAPTARTARRRARLEAAGSTGAARCVEFALANRCFALVSRAIRGVVGRPPTGIGAAPEDDPAFYFKPTGLGTYMLSDQDGRLIGLGDPAARRRRPRPAAEWAATLASKRTVRFRSTVDRPSLAVEHTNRALVSVAGNAGQSGRFDAPARRQLPPLSRGRARRNRQAVQGHQPRRHRARLRRRPSPHHLRACAPAARVVYGEAFDRFGITEALGHDAEIHGADGSDDVTGNLLRDGLPFGTHDTTAGRRSPAGRATTPTPTSRSITGGWSGRGRRASGWSSRRRSRTSRCARSSRASRTPATRPR